VPTNRTIRNTLRSLSTIIDWPANGRKQALTTTKSNIFHPSLKNSWTLGVNEINLRQISETKSPKIILSKERNIVPCSSEISGYESNPTTTPDKIIIPMKNT
jgi:hypothetical protein